jgi:hypothetical protein
MNEGAIRLRSNIVLDPESWDLVPGDALQRYAPYRLKAPYRPTRRQHDEHMYYVPCHCGRRIHQIRLEGCNECADGPSEAKRAETVARHEQARRRVVELRRQAHRSDGLDGS